jgi:hypothetical protein
MWQTTRLLFLAGVAFSCGCTTAQKPTIAPDEVTVATPPPSAAPAPSPASVADAPPPQQALPAPKLQRMEQPPERALPVLGTPCTAQTEGCGKSGTLAVVVDPTRARHARGADATQHCTLDATQPANAPAPTGYLGYACASDDRLYVSSVCMMCRMHGAGSSLEGILSQMTNAQIAAAQKMAGLPASPLLTTEVAWNKAIAAAKKQK